MSSNKKKIIITLFWLILIFGLTSFVGVFVLASKGFFGQMPDLQQLENPKTNLATQIITSDNRIIGKYYFKDIHGGHFNKYGNKFVSDIIFKYLKEKKLL